MKINAVAIRGETEEDVVPLARFAREHGLELRFIEYMPLDAGHLWEREKVLFAADIIDLIAPRDSGRSSVVSDQDPRAPALDYEYADGGGQGRLHRVGEPAVLHELQPDAADVRRQAAQLPVLARGNRCARAAARRCKRCRDCAGDSRLRGLEVGRPRDQHLAIHPARAADALDRRLKLAS